MSSLFLWQLASRAMAADHRRHRLIKSLILLVQLLVIELLAAALAGPQFHRNGAAVHLGVIVDTSTSMAAGSEETRRRSGRRPGAVSFGRGGRPLYPVVHHGHPAPVRRPFQRAVSPGPVRASPAGWKQRLGCGKPRGGRRRPGGKPSSDRPRHRRGVGRGPERTVAGPGVRRRDMGDSRRVSAGQRGHHAVFPRATAGERATIRSWWRSKTLGPPPSKDSSW